MKHAAFQRLTRLPLALTVLGVVGSSCGLRETRSNSATSLLGQMQKASNAGAVTATPKVSVQLDELRKQLRDATEFWKLSLDQESKERKEADASIRSDVVALSERVDALRTRLDSEISRLDKTLREEFDSKLQAQESKLSSQISAEKTARENALKLVDENLRQAQDTLSTKISSLDTKTQDAIKATNAKLIAAETKINSALAEGQKYLLSEMKALEERSNKSTDQLKTDLTTMIKSSDDAAQTKFVELQNQMKLAKDALVAQQNSLKLQMDTANAELKAQLTVSNQALADRIQVLDLVTQTDLKKAKDELEAKILNNGNELSNLISLARDEAQKNLVKAVGESNAQLVAVMTQADNALRAELSQKISSESAAQAEALEAFKKEANSTFAKQVDLTALMCVVNGLSNALNILDHKVDDNDKRLTESVKSLRSELVSKIGSVQATVSSLQNDFTAHVATYQQKVAELSADTRAAANALKAEMATSAAYDADARLKLQQSIEALSAKLTNTEDFAIKTRDALTGKIVELEQRDAELSNEVREARNAATAELSAAIAKEQQARQAIADDVKKLQAEVERVGQVANQALALSRANEMAVSGLKDDLAKVSKEMNDRLEALRGEMESDMNELRQQSQLVMFGLGLNTQSHFAETVTQLANLKNKLAGLSLELGRVLEKGFKLSSDPVMRSSSADRVMIFIQKVAKEMSQSSGGRNIALHELTAQRMDELSKVLGRVESEFLLAIDYAEVLDDAQKIADLRALNQSFIDKVVILSNASGTQVCSSANRGLVIGGVPRIMSSVNHNEFWAHLARAYAQMVISGSRSGNSDLDKIFHGTTPHVDGQSFQSALAMAALPSTAVGAGGECISRINDWAKSVLFGSSGESVRLRNALFARQGLKKLLSEGALAAAYRGLSSPAANIEILAKETLKVAFNSDEAKAFVYLRTGDLNSQDPGFYAAAAQIIREYAATLAQITAVEQNLNNLINVSITANSRIINSRAIAAVTQLRERLAKIDKLDERVNRIGTGTVNAFGLIASMAARMGYGDIVDKAKAEVTKLADISPADPSMFLPVGCSATSHFFNYAEQDQPLQRCDSGVSTSDGNYGDNGKCRTSQTNTTSVHTYVNTNTNTTYNINYYPVIGSIRFVNTRGCRYGLGCYDNWYNMGTVYTSGGTTTSTTVSTSTSASVSTTLNQAIVGPLTVPWLSPLDATAQSILKRAPGSPFPADKKTMIGLRIFGNAGKWRIEDPESGRRIELNASDFKVADTAQGLVYEIPAAMFLAKTNGQAGFTETARITALNSDGSLGIANGSPAKTCLHSMNGGTHNVTRNTTSYSSSSTSNTSYNYGGVFYNHGYFGTRFYTSPLVLDLKPNRKLETIAPNMSNAMFDLQGSGMKQRVGWIAKDTGLLALDLNGNGKIDNGRELFGDFTKLKSGALASNGYEALAEYDDNKDGVINGKDKVFKKLVLWTDDNGDGVTQKGELKKLSQLGITGVGVKFEQAAADERIQHRDSVKQNLVLYKARYFGSHCPENGCRSYDVYFGNDDLVQPVATK